ncbi:MAG: spermidine/putrescine ABC transporter substrate-binding protein [Acidimicrobiia bacterium]|nr:spermidine/putrescine ABC transporter substrate-binding protein [Acidimicrobiia bacterium]
MTDRQAMIRTEALRLARMAGTPRWSRRQFLGRSAALLGVAAVGPAILAACGSDESSGGSGKSVTVSNWVDYMAPKSPKAFTDGTGIELKYKEDINDNNEYFAKVKPNLSKGESIGTDAFVLTDWMANRMINQVKWVQQLDDAKFPNKANMRVTLQKPPFDPTRAYSAPWQSGLTGIAYNIKETGKEIRTLDEFLAIEGSTTVLAEMRDTVGIFMLATGADPSVPTHADSLPAFDKLQKAIDDGSIGGTNGNEYVNDLASGNLAAAFAWSGDVAQISRDNADVRFMIPESGGMLWSDNLMIPSTSEKPGLASEFINFFYDPVNAAVLTNYIQYIAPVDGVEDELIKMGGSAAKLVDDPLVVPTAELLANVKIFGGLDEEEEVQFDEHFANITGTG